MLHGLLEFVAKFDNHISLGNLFNYLFFFSFLMIRPSDGVKGSHDYMVTVLGSCVKWPLALKGRGFNAIYNDTTSTKFTFHDLYLYLFET